MFIVSISTSVLPDGNVVRVDDGRRRTKRLHAGRRASLGKIMPDEFDGGIQSVNGMRKDQKTGRNLRIDVVARLDPVVLFWLEKKLSDDTAQAVGADDYIGGQYFAVCESHGGWSVTSNRRRGGRVRIGTVGRWSGYNPAAIQGPIREIFLRKLFTRDHL